MGAEVSLPVLVFGIVLVCVFGRAILAVVNFVLRSWFIFFGVALSLGAIGYVVMSLVKG